MICQECQMRPATLRFMKIHNGEKTEYHLCEVCAREKGESLPGSPNAFSIHNLLSGLLTYEQSGEQSQQRQNQWGLHCPQCGLSYSQFSKIGRFGCPECYKTFEAYTEPLFRRVQGSTVHAGKIPKRVGSRLQARREIDLLKKELSRLIESEEFEAAAKIRDEIRQFEKKLESGKEA